MEEMEVEEFEDPSSERVLTWGSPQLIHLISIGSSIINHPAIVGTPMGLRNLHLCVQQLLTFPESHLPALGSPLLEVLATGVEACRVISLLWTTTTFCRQII